MDKTAAEAAYTPAASSALHEFGIEAAALELVSLSENVTFRVTDAAGADFVLRLHRPGYHTRAELNSERDWIRALAAAGIGVPTPVLTHGGEDFVARHIAATGEERQVGVTHWLDGEILARVLRGDHDAQRVEGYFEQLGAISAAIHNQASGWQPPPGFARHAFDLDGLMGEAPFWGRFWEHPELTVAERQLLLSTRERIRGVLGVLRQDPAIYSLIHADLHPGNLLVSGERLVVIDFDDAGFGWHHYEAAVALGAHARTPAYAGIEAAYLRGYRRLRPFSDDAAALIAMFLLIRGMVSIGWIAARPELDRGAYFAQLRATVLPQCATFSPP